MDLDAFHWASSSPVFQLTVDPEDLLWEHWEDAVTLFNRCSGETHILSLAAAELLLLLVGGPMSRSDLVTLLGERCDCLGDGQWPARVDQMLRGLASIDLIEPADHSACAIA